MPDSALDPLIARLLADPACHLAPATQPADLPKSLPEDVRYFFSQCAGGKLFYEFDYKTPQFGCELFYRDEQPISRRLECDGPEFEQLYSIAEFVETGELDCAVVSTHPDTFGRIYYLSYSLGDPSLTFAEASLLAPSFTRWLEMHVEAWDVYLADWREGLEHFTRLIKQERRKADLRDA